MNATTTYAVIVKATGEIVEDGLTMAAARKLRATNPADYGVRKDAAVKVEATQEEADAFEAALKEAQVEGEPTEMDDLFTAEGPALGADITPEVEEVTEEEAPAAPAEEAKPQAAYTAADLQIWGLRDAGLTWRLTAEIAGFGWNGANMDGGRALRAWKRADKAILAGLVTPKDCRDALLDLAEAEDAIVEAAAKAKAKVDAARAKNAKRDAKAKAAPKAKLVSEDEAVKVDLSDLAWA